MASDLHEILGGVSKEIDISNAEAQRAERMAAQKLRELREQVIGGQESTGSHLHDGIVALYGDWLLDGEPIVERYEKVATLLEAAHLMDPVILISRVEGHDGSSFMGAALETTVSMGLLKAKQLAFDYHTGTAYLQTSLFAGTNLSDRQLPERASGNIPVDSPRSPFDRCGLGFSLDTVREIERDMLVSRQPMPVEEYIALELLVGVPQINEWLGDENQFDLSGKLLEFSAMRRLSQALGIPLVQPQTDRQRQATS